MDDLWHFMPIVEKLSKAEQNVVCEKVMQIYNTIGITKTAAVKTFTGIDTVIYYGEVDALHFVNFWQMQLFDLDDEKPITNCYFVTDPCDISFILAACERFLYTMQIKFESRGDY